MQIELPLTEKPKPRPHWSTFARGARKQRGVMNKLETAYAAVLDAELAAGTILWYRYEAITLTLSHGVAGGAKGNRLTVDFFVMLADGTLVCKEVKGFANDRQMNALKTAAELYPFRFLLIEKRTKKNGGGWRETEF